ncbi:hypothetical protein DN069_38995, partial [Streptacidiphilus pinicola]
MGVGTGCGGALILVAAATVTVLATVLTLTTGGLGGFSGSALSSGAVADIPAVMLTLYQQAAATCTLPWTVLAAIGKVESDHGRARDEVSSAGALGPMQFEPATFAAYDQPVPPGGASPPTPRDRTDPVYAAPWDGLAARGEGTRAGTPGVKYP